MATTQQQQHKLPAGLAGVLNNPEDQRDSAYYSSKDASSKREHSLTRLCTLNSTDNSYR
jgi:hypothetical protein